MMYRCYEPSTKHYNHYGGRGIKVCNRWHRFLNFLIDMGDCPKGLTLERINTNGNYKPSNCKWATWKEQADNKRTTVKITIGGITKTRTHWAKSIGIHPLTLQGRLDRGYGPSKAVKTKRKKHDRSLIAFNGTRMSISDWADALGLKYSTLHGRIRNNGWSIKRALTTP